MHAAVVEVDRECCAVRILRYVVVHDCGTIINPTIVEGQIYGGVAQGIGGALYERIAYDEDGQLQNASFMDFLMPYATEVPEPELHHTETPSPNNELGRQGGGGGRDDPGRGDDRQRDLGRARDADRPHADLPVAAPRADAPVTGVRIGIDTGGTFTDVVAVDPDGHVRSTKVPSSPSDPATAFMRRSRRPGRRRSATSPTARRSPPTRCSRTTSAGSG